MPKNADKKCHDVCSDNITPLVMTHTVNRPMVTSGKSKNAENATNFICKMCDFTCSKYSNYVTHLSTRKHQMITSMVTTDAKNAETIHVVVVPNTCTNCNRHYLHRSGLARHKKTCIPTPGSIPSTHTTHATHTNHATHTTHATQPITRDEYNHILHLLHELKNKNNSTVEPNDDYDNDDISLKQNTKVSSSGDSSSQLIIDNNIRNKLMLELIKSNTQLQNQMYEICKLSQAPTTNNINAHIIHDNSNTTTNSNNSTFNMNVFLNEKCKDAMNMKDFVNSIQLNLTDLENVGRLGYVEGISNIFIDNLQKTDIYKRPVHCSDVKRETLYVKDNNQWERDGPDHEKMTNAVLAVEQKNVALVNEWAKANPKCMNSNTRENEIYFKLSKAATDGEKDGNIAKVIRKVAKRVMIEKDQKQIEDS